MKDTINLLPKKGPEENKAKRKKRLTLVIITAIFIVLLLIWGILFLQKESLVKEQKNLIVSIEQKEKSIASMSLTENLYRTVYSKSSAGGQLLRTRDDFMNRVDKVEAYLNAGVSIRDMTIDNEETKLAVVATDIGAISDYLKGLENEDRRSQTFKSLTLSQIYIDKVAGYEVGIEGTFAQ